MYGLPVFQKKREKKMSYLILKLVQEWGDDRLAHNKNMGEEFKAAIIELVAAATKVMKFL